MSKSKNNLSIKIISIIIIFAFLSSIVLSESGYAQGLPNENLSPQSAFAPLANKEIKDMAMLEYVLLSRIFSEEADVMEWIESRKDISTSISGEKAHFSFSSSTFDRLKGLALISCDFGDTRYWCFAKRKSTPSEETGLSYDFMFYTESEVDEEGVVESLYNLKIKDRKEQLAIQRARDSEKNHDEKIREAILSDNYLSITEGYAPITFIYGFLDVVAPRLSGDFREIVNSGQLMVITEERDGLRLEEPHAGGRGIYLPKYNGYDTPLVIVHEIFAKAGFTHEEATRMEKIFDQYAKRKGDAIIDTPARLPEWMDLTTQEEETLKLARFADLTEKIKTRDYSQNQDGKSSIPRHDKKKPLRVLLAEDDENQALLTKMQLERSGFELVGYKVVSTARDFAAALGEKEWDVVISDYTMPGFSGREALKIFKDKKMAIPFILATDSDDLNTIVDMFRAGITDYVSKGDLSVKLGPMIEKLREGMKRNASQHQQSDESGQYRLMNMLPIGVHIVTSMGIIRDVNEKELELLGYTREEMIGKSIFNFVDQSQVNDAVKRFHDKLAGKQVSREKVDRLYVKKDGTTIIGYTQDHVLRNSVGTPMEIVTSFEDITERRATQKRLEESEAKFKEVFTESPIGFVVLDFAGDIVDANPAAISVIGAASFNDIMGKNIREYMDFIELGKGPLRREASLDYEKLKEQGTYEPTKKGKIYVEYSLTPVGAEGEGQSPVKYHLQVRDITREHEDEEKLKNAYTELERKTAQLIHAERLSAIGENTAALADGINNPANNIKSIVEGLLARMLNGSPVESEEVEKVLSQVTDQIARITSITEKFQGFARGHTGRIPVSIQDILSDAIEVRKFLTKNMGVKVHLNFKDDWSVVIADKVLLTQAFADMILNATSSMKGTDVKDLTITTEHSRDEDGKDWVKVSFTDTGMGLAKAELDDIWNPFHKSPESGKESGFALVIVKDMVNEHGGRVKVESEIGKGTTFSMELPVIRHYKEEIKHFSTLELGSIYSSLWHDLNNTLGAAYTLEIMLDSGYDIPEDLKATIKAVFGEVKEIAALIKTAHHNYDSEELLGRIDKKISALNDLGEIILAAEVTPSVKMVFKNAISRIFDNIHAANKKIEEGHRLLDAVHTEDAKKDVYKGLWKALDSIMDDSEKFMDIMISTFTEGQSEEVVKKMIEAKALISEAKYFLDRALADREEILTKIEAKVEEIMPKVEEIADRMSSIVSSDDVGLVVGVKKGLAETVQKIREVRKMLGIEHSFEAPLTKVKALEVLKDVASFFKTSKRFFKQNDVDFDEVEELSYAAKNLFIKADDPAFRYALYNVLSVGFSDDMKDKRKLDPQKRRINISADRNGTTGEVIFTFRNNYYSFSEENLEEVDLGHGEKGPAILKWQDDKSTPLALAHKILASFAGRITIRSDENGSTIRIFIPYVEEVEGISEERDENEEKSRKKELDAENSKEKSSGWPEVVQPNLPNIVIADDEDLVRDLLKNMLGEKKYNIWLAADGQEALDIIEGMKAEGIDVHLGLFDISMPKVDGVALTRTAREKGYNFPILVITGHAITDPKVQQLEADGSIEGIMTKPFSIDDIRGRVSKLVKAAALPKNEKALELQMASADKVALVYGENTSEGIKKLRSVGFKGEVRSAKNEEELKGLLTSGEQFDFIVNTTKEDITDLLKRIFSEFESVPEVVDAGDMNLQERLITICA